MGTSTMTEILDGKIVSENTLKQIQESIPALSEKIGRKPGLAVILVGDNPASQVYVNHKKKACTKIGIDSFETRLTAEDGEEKLISVIKEHNENPNIDGILLQLPLPKGFDEDKMLSLISPQKDVDGFHPENVGRLLQGLPTFKSCTPYGVCEILKFYNIDPEGQHVVIVGRSNIVGKPLAAMLVQKESGANATVTICHSRSKNLSDITRQADILIAAIGIPEFIKEDMVKDGAVVIDVGINRIEDSSHPKGSRLVGDVDFNTVKLKSKAITPVPGGVGPMTIAMLMKNTLFSFTSSYKTYR